MTTLPELKLELERQAKVLVDLHRRVKELESSKAQRDAEWKHERDTVLEAVRTHVGTVVTDQLAIARKAIEDEMVKVNVVLLRLEKTGNLGTLEKLVNLLSDEAKVGLLRDAIDEQIYLRVEKKKKTESHADLTASLDLEEKKLKPFYARITAFQVVVAIVGALITALGAAAALSHVTH